jgi:hypothetical protein
MTPRRNAIVSAGSPQTHFQRVVGLIARPAEQATNHAIIMAGKKGGGESSKRAAGLARKAEASTQKAAAEDAKKAAVEDAEWQKGAKSNAKKCGFTSPFLFLFFVFYNADTSGGLGKRRPPRKPTQRGRRPRKMHFWRTRKQARPGDHSRKIVKLQSRRPVA